MLAKEALSLSHPALHANRGITLSRFRQPESLDMIDLPHMVLATRGNLERLRAWSHAIPMSYQRRKAKDPIVMTLRQDDNA